jgi:DNA-binding CsgD family transcriptional regulator
MLALYGAGMTASEVAEQVGVHESTVRAHARRQGVVPPPTVSPEVLAEYAAGAPAATLAQRCGVTPATILRHAKLNGVAAPSHEATPGLVAQIVALYSEGVRIVEIGKRFRMGHRAARRLLVDAGVAIRPRGHRPSLAEHQDEIIRLRAEGVSYRRIGERLGAAASTVRGFHLGRCQP